ncbi:hypothetical protein WP50_00835, partial [Lactiplantibacillus plantarum]
MVVDAHGQSVPFRLIDQQVAFHYEQEVARFVAHDALTTLTAKINTTDFNEQAKPFVVVNTT